MAIHTQQSVSGFIASDPQLSYTERGEARFFARIGQENYRREEDGSFTKLEPSFHPDQQGNAPLGWHRDFADAGQRLRDLVAASGTSLDGDRPTRQIIWPAERPSSPVEDALITDRDDEFVDFVRKQVRQRQEAEDILYAVLADVTSGPHDSLRGDQQAR